MPQDEGDRDELAGNIELAAADRARRRPAATQGQRRTLDEDRVTIRSTLEFLAEPAVAAAVLAETGAGDDRAAAALGLFAEAVEPLAPRVARPALRWLRAMAYERLGDIEQAESDLPTPRSRWTRRGR